MLQYILGIAKSGKTTKIIDFVKKLSDNNKKSVIIVPEQASFETENAVYKALGDSFSLNVEVLSFSRLYDKIIGLTGGLSAKTLDDSHKVIFMNKALKSLESELKLWSRYAKSLTFAQKMLDTVGEFKINGISSQELKKASELTETLSLKNKLKDLSLIYDTYDLYTAEKFIDPADKLTKLYNKLENCAYFKDKTVFFDGFKGFTGQQYKIIDRVLKDAKDVFFGFTYDNTNIGEYNIFSNIRSSINKIDLMAQNHNISIKEPIVLNQSYYFDPSLSLIERLISENEIIGDCSNSVTVCKANTAYDEADYVARTIRQLIRTENYRFKDFAIITRDSEKYSQPVEYACKKNNIECFFDKKFSLMSFPLSITSLSAIKSLNFSSENILRFHKSGIDILSTEEISELENYVYIWKIEGDMWLNEWDMDIRGFVNDEMDQDALISLEKINSLRVRAIEPIKLFKDSFTGDVKQKSKAIIKLLDFCAVSEKLKNICDKLNSDIYTVDAIKQSYDAFINVLDNIVSCYGNSELSKNEYYDVLSLALSLEEIGLIPQKLDQVIFGQADRIRVGNPKIVFILGANQGLFPKITENKSIFSIKERKNLIKLDININDNEIYSSIDERFLVYSNLCSASQKLYISFCEASLSGQSLEASAFVTNIINSLNPKVITEPSEKLNSLALPETKASAFSEYCRRSANNQDFQTLKSVLNSNGININRNFGNLENYSISKNTAKYLYGEKINMSATKFDTFHRCKFSYFCRYGLKLKKLQQADFDVLQRGTIVHYVLERVISEYKENIKNLSFDELDILCDKYIDEYLNSVQGFRSIENAHHKFIISKISRALKEVLHHLSLEFAQSDFKPTHCELLIGSNDKTAVKFPFENGEINLIGSIDRVDEYNGYIRIIDYKTGTKSFKLPDILFGLNLQMLIYLYAVTRGRSLPDDSAAGIFYMPAKRDLNSEGMAMNGLLQGDLDLVKSMEKENNGEFIPKLKLNNDGSISKSASSFISKEEFSKIFDHIERLMQNIGASILSGEIKANPIDGRESTACGYCDFKSICKIEDKEILRVPDLKNYEVFEKIGEESENGI